MEPVNSSIRAFNHRQQSTSKLTGKPSYHRVHLSSDHKEADSTTTDATFDVSGIPLVSRQDLLDGHWEVFVEEWVAFIDSANRHNPVGARKTLKLCLPDLMVATQDGTSTAVGVARRDDAVCQVPLEFAWVPQAYTIPETYGLPTTDIITGCDETNGQITITSTANLVPGMPFSVAADISTFDDGPFDMETYYVKAIINGTDFTATETPGGALKALTRETGVSTTVVFNAPALNVWVSGLKQQNAVYVNFYQEVQESHFNNIITADAVGRTVNPQQLINGKLRVQLKDRNHAPIATVAYNQPTTNYNGAMTDADRWQVTLLFVHKP